MRIQLILKNDSGHVKKSIKVSTWAKVLSHGSVAPEWFSLLYYAVKELKPFNSSNMDVNGVVIDHKLSDLLTYTVAI